MAPDCHESVVVCKLNDGKSNIVCDISTGSIFGRRDARSPVLTYIHIVEQPPMDGASSDKMLLYYNYAPSSRNRYTRICTFGTLYNTRQQNV